MAIVTRGDILKFRISILFIRERYTFLNTLKDFQATLRRNFVEDYTLDEIEDSLNELEQQFIDEPEKVFEIEEHYN
jgi:hypothetical protein